MSKSNRMASCELSCISYLALYVISLHILDANSRMSVHWKLNSESNRIVQAAENDGSAVDDAREQQKIASNDSDPAEKPAQHQRGDAVFNILTRPAKVSVDGVWEVELQEFDGSCSHCDSDDSQVEHEEGGSRLQHAEKASSKMSSRRSSSDMASSSSANLHSELASNRLECGETVNFTYLDHLVGIVNRKHHPQMPEPEVAVNFRKKNCKSSHVDMSQLEAKLRKAMKDRPKSAQVYNQVGNYWRIKGDTYRSIECFRKAISLAPQHSDVLLNLARVLFNLQYLDDAMFLTRRSLDVASADNIWLQHYTMGEILKAYGHYHEAAMHFRHALDLNPSYQPAEFHIREMEALPDTTLTIYTFLIIVFLVMVVLFGVLATVEASSESVATAAGVGDPLKTQRHFNRAMAMRSIRLGGMAVAHPRASRMKKNHVTPKVII